ncbi:RNA-binding S4 domain-containing protein [Microbacterium foliorum]
MADAARVDSWLWAIRVYKTRSAATTACRAGHVRVRIAGFDRILVVRQLLVKRVGAPVAALAYEDRTPEREPQAALGLRDRGAGRPTKRERRDIDKLRGRGYEDDGIFPG